MRNLFLTLVLANLLLLAWQFWIDPSAPGPDRPGGQPGPRLEVYQGSGQPRSAASRPAETLPRSGPAGADQGTAAGACLRVGPLPSETAAQEAGAALVRQGIDATPIAQDAQLWLGHWVQIPGFSTVAEAEAARQRLVAGGVPDAYLMQDGPQPMISLGVFRDRAGADRVASAARGLGLGVTIRDRYRPTVEQWLLVRLQPGQVLAPETLSLTGDRIMRTEPVACDGRGPGLEPGADVPLPTRPE